MKEMHHHWTEEQKAGYILQALAREEISAELLASIQGWMLSDDSAVGKEKELDALLDRMFEHYRFPTPQTYALLDALHRTYGLPPVKRPRKRPSRLGRRMLRVAAVLLPGVALAGALWLWDGRPTEARTDTPAVAARVEALPNAENNTVALPDGSTIRLTPGSRVEVAADFAENRSVALFGEAFFSVAKDPEKPFTVQADPLTVTVLGTEFNLNARAEQGQTVVSLTDGRVEVRDGSHSTVLAPMEQLTYDKATGRSTVTSFSSEQVDRWRFGRQTLNDVPLPEALKQVGAFYGKTTVIEGSLPRSASVTTLLRETADLESMLEVIRLMNHSFEYTLRQDTLYITRTP